MMDDYPDRERLKNLAPEELERLMTQEKPEVEDDPGSLLDDAAQGRRNLLIEYLAPYLH